MTRRRPPGSVLTLSNALLLLIVLPLFTAAQQQQPRSNALHRSPPEHPALNNKQRSGRSTHLGTAHRNGKDTAVISTNERALATYAPADAAVRAPPARSASAGLSSRHPARSLQDWQVEDIILLATVDGKIHAMDRETGASRWELETDRPMVETIYHKSNKSASEDLTGDDDFLWIVEPSQDGSLYLYAPGRMQKTGLTVKQLAEELSPHAGEDPPVVYTAEKKNTLYTVDARNGNILKVFSSAGPVVNDDRNCRKVNALEGKDDECETVGTLMLGRTEYTVAIQNRDTGETICTIRYFEWGPNNRDKDLHSQYASTMDNKYIYSRFDGSVSAWDHTKTNGFVADWQRPMFSHKFSSPVARVYDIVRPFDDVSTVASLVILPQPVGPTDGLPETSDIFVNCTESGSWYALSEQSYPTITQGATRASCYSIHSWHQDSDGLSYASPLAKQRAKLVGIHPLSAMSAQQNIPTISGPEAPSAIDMPAESASLPYDLDSPHNKWTEMPSPWTVIIPLLIFVLYLAQKQLFDKVPGFKALTNRNTPIDLGATVPTVSVSQPDNTMPISSAALVDDTSADPPKIREAEPAIEKTFTNGSEVESQPSFTPDPSAEAAENVDKAAYPPGPPVDDTPAKPKARRGVRGGRKQKEKREQQLEAQQRKRNNSQASGAEARNAVEAITVAESESPNVKGKIQINNLVIDTDRVIGHGSAGTCVFEGTFGKKKINVAVKRMLSQYYELADQEITFLSKSDDHPNVVRYYCEERDQHFLYIAVELCQASLWDLFSPDSARDEARREQLTRLLHEIQKDVPKALRQIVAGLHHLHYDRIIHRDIKPQNILVAYPRRKDDDLRLVISDFGLCKTLPENVSTLIDPTASAGTCGWKAPELILQPKDTLSQQGSSPGHPTTSESASGGGASGVKRAADIFSLGCLFFWVLTGGCHPFDDKEGWIQMRERNIKLGRAENMNKLFDLGVDTEEPRQLIKSMLAQQPEHRPTAAQVLCHPFFWNPEKRLRFLVDVSDHFEHEPRDPPSEHLAILEDFAAGVIPKNKQGELDFLDKLDFAFIQTLGKQRKYSGARMLDLLRALRNKVNHYEDMPVEVQKRVGALRGGGYLGYWTMRFPNLLMACYYTVRECGIDGNDRFEGYFRAE